MTLEELANQHHTQLNENDLYILNFKLKIWNYVKEKQYPK